MRFTEWARKHCAAVPELVHQLDSTDWRARELAAAGLGKIGPAARNAAPHLVRRLATTTTPDVRIAAGQALLRIEPDATHAMPVLEKLLNDKQAQIASERLIHGGPLLEGVD